MSARTACLSLSVALAALLGAPGLHAAPPDALALDRTAPLRDVAAVKQALGRGQRVNATVDLGLCTSANGAAPSQTRGGLAV